MRALLAAATGIRSRVSHCRRKPRRPDSRALVESGPARREGAPPACLHSADGLLTAGRPSPRAHGRGPDPGLRGHLLPAASLLPKDSGGQGGGIPISESPPLRHPP